MPAPVLVISHEIVGPQLAGPGIRYLQLARVLARELPVTLAIPASTPALPMDGFDLLTYDTGDVRALDEAVRQARAVVVPAVWWERVAALAETMTPVVLDCYNPFIAETLVLNPDHARDQHIALTRAYLAGDFFMCASERQRDWLLGTLEALGRINSYTYAADPSFRNLVDLVPFGLPSEPPRKTRAVIRGVWPGIGDHDVIALWGGGLWPWLDPLTAIRAVAEMRAMWPNLRLIFPGTRHPNPAMASILTHTEAARALAANLGVLDRHVFFGDWVPYADWPDVLLESDLALTLHGPETLESHLAFRSRVLDYVWAGLPIIATRGDATADLINQYNLGFVLPEADVPGLVEAMTRVLNEPHTTWAARFAPAREALTWARAAQPLLGFGRQPRRAADRNGSELRAEHPWYMSEVAQLRARLATYERMNYVRFVQWLHPYRQRLQALFRPRAVR